jgi:hypothetical protein
MCTIPDFTTLNKGFKKNLPQTINSHYFGYEKEEPTPALPKGEGVS